MQQGGAVPTPPDTVLGPTFPESSSVSNLLLGLDSTEEAAQGSEIRWDTVDLDDYDFSPFEYPEWVNTLPTDATLDQWFEDNAGPAVNKPFQGQMPTKEGDVEFITADQADIDSYNSYIQRRNDAAELLNNQIEEYQGLQDLERQHNENINAQIERLARDVTPESFEEFALTGNGANLVPNQRRLAYNLPTGRSERAILTLGDLGEGVLSSDTSIIDFEQMIDEYIAENKDGQDGQINDKIQKEIEARMAFTRGQLRADEIEKIREKATADYQKDRRENAGKLIISEMARNLADEEVRNDPEQLTQFEAQVFEDLSNDFAANKFQQDVQMPTLTRVSIDDDASIIGARNADPFTVGGYELLDAQTVDNLKALYHIGFPQAEKSFRGTVAATDRLGNEIDKALVGLNRYIHPSYSGLSEQEADQRDEELINIYDERTQDSYANYLEHKDRIESKIAAARENLDKYTYTRDQLRSLGTLAGYSSDQLASMSADAIISLERAQRESQTALGGLMNAEEYRQGLESMPTSLMYLAPQAAITALTGGVGGAAMGVAFTTYGMGSGVYMEEYANLDTNPLFEGLPEETKHGIALVHGGAEGAGEALGNLLFAKMPGILSSGGRLTSAKILGDPILKRSARILNGIMMGSGLGAAEEYAAEGATAYLQLLADDFAEARSSGRVRDFDQWWPTVNLIQFAVDHAEEISEASRIGAGMGLTMGSGSAIVGYSAAGAQRVFDRSAFQMEELASHLAQQDLFEGADGNFDVETQQKLDRLKAMSPTELAGAEGQALAADVAGVFSNMSHTMGKTKQALLNLADSNPQMLVQAYELGMRIQNMERASGKYSQTEDGRWKLNGRFISDPTNTKLYKYNQSLSEEARRKLKDELRESRQRLKLYRLQGEVAGVFGSADTSSRLKRIKQLEEKLVAPDGSITIDKDTDLSVIEDEKVRKMVAAIQAKLKEGDVISLHSDDSVLGKDSDGEYREYNDGTREIAVVANSDQLPFVLAHEYGHMLMEDHFADDQNRAKVFEEVVAEVRASGQDELLVEIMRAYDMLPQESEAARAARGAGVDSDVILSKAYGAMSAEQKAEFEREVITNYIDQVARGNVADKSNKVMKGLVGRSLTQAGMNLGLVSETDLTGIAHNYMSTLREMGDIKSFRAQSREAVQEAQSMLSEAEQASVEETEKNVDRAEKGLPSKKLGGFKGGTVVMQFNRNAFEGEIGVKYKTITRNFNDYFHLMNFWRKMTGNGIRPVIGRMAYEVDGQYVEIKKTDKWVKRDRASGLRVEMTGAISSRQFQLQSVKRQQDLELEFGRQRSALSREVQLLAKEFQFSGFSLDYHSFFDPQYNNSSMRGLMEAKRNMIALLDKGHSELYFDNLRSDKKFQYLIDFKTNPELFRLAEPMGSVPLENQAAELVARAEKLGTPAWMFSTPGSAVHTNQIEDLYGANQAEMNKIKAAIEAYENGQGTIGGSGVVSGPGLKAIKLDPSKFSKKQVSHPLVQVVPDFGFLADQGVTSFRIAKYARTRSGNISLPIRTLSGDEKQSVGLVLADGVMGTIEHEIRKQKLKGETDAPFGPSHVEADNNFYYTANEALSNGKEQYFVFIAVRSEENSLRNENVIRLFANYMNQYLEENPEDIGRVKSAVEKMINEKEKTFKYKVDTDQGVEDRSAKISYKRIFTASELDSIEEIEDGGGKTRLRLKDLRSFFSEVAFDEDFASDLSFERRAEILRKMLVDFHSLTNEKTVSVSEFLDAIDEPSFRGLPSGAVVAAYQMDAFTAKENKDQRNLRKKYRKLDSKKKDSSYGKFIGAASFPATTLGMQRMYIPENTELSGEFLARAMKVEGSGKEGGESSLSMTYNRVVSAPPKGLQSRRLPGRIYVEGNSSWEKSSATPYGAMLQAAALKYQDRFSDVLLLQQDVEVFRKSKVPESMDFEMAMDVYYGRVRNDLEQLEAVVKDIQSDLRKFDISNKDLSDYLYAKHAVERNADILSKDPSMKDGSGMTDAEAIALINKLETSEMMQIADRVYKLVENTRDTMVQGGLESASVVDEWRQRYKYYVPLNGLAVDELSDVTNDYPTGGSGMAVYGPSVKKARGRRSKTEHNLLSNIVMQNAAVKQRARKDKAMLTLYNLVKENPNPKVWSVVGPNNPMKVRGRALSAAELKASPNAVPIRINGKQHFIYFKDQSYAMALNGMTIEKLNKINASMAKYIGFLRNSYTVWNPAFFISNFARDFEMAIANSAAEIEREGGILEGYGLDAKTFAKALSKTTFSTMKALVKESALGFAGAKLDPEMQRYMDEWKAAGGQTGFSYSETLNEVVAKLNGLTTKTPRQEAMQKAGDFLSKYYANPVQFFKYVEGLNEAFENSVRLASYIEARKAGMTASRAAQLSKNITVNFNKSGEYTPGINSWFLFFNASVQGSTRLARSLRKNEMYVEKNQGGTTNKWHNRLSTTAKISAGMVLFSSMQTLFNMAVADEGEDGISYYDKIPDYRKERNWIIMAGPRDPIYIPMPYGLNIFHNLGMILTEVGSGHREIADGAAFLASALHSSFSPIGFGQYDTVGETVTMALTPTALKPGTETFLFNKTYFGGEVYREQLPFGTEVPEYQLAYRSPEYLIEFAKYLNQISGGTTEVSGKVNVNPDPYYYLAQSLTGGAGKFVGDIAELSRGMVAMTRKNIDRAMTDDDFIKSLLNVEQDEVIKIRRSDVPLLKLMYGEASRFYDTDLYRKNIQELEQAEKEMKEGESTDFNVTGVQALRSQAKRTADMLKNIRDLKKKARETEDYVDRQNAIYKLQEAERMEYMLFNATYEELRGQYIN